MIKLIKEEHKNKRRDYNKAMCEDLTAFFGSRNCVVMKQFKCVQKYDKGV